ncbi:MAG: hypothetical protein LBI69_04880 [Puniceicoccales bacterium]|jgi:hypothetical protein|nr:hypothetical protein [Puniceicoccales bacterium]
MANIINFIYPLPCFHGKQIPLVAILDEISPDVESFFMALRKKFFQYTLTSKMLTLDNLALKLSGRGNRGGDKKLPEVSIFSHFYSGK